MASFRPGEDFALDVLEVARRLLRKQNACHAAEIWAELSRLLGGGAYLEYHYPYHVRRFWPESPIAAIEAALSRLEDLGLVRNNADREESSGLPIWGLADSWQPPDPPGNGGDFNGGDGPGGGGDGDDGDGGGGLAEVLGHPVLFALADEDFDELVDTLFDGANP